MKSFFKSKKGKVITIALILVLVVGGIGCYFIFRQKLKYDYRLGKLAETKVENAQYIPDVDKFIESTPEVIALSSKSCATSGPVIQPDVMTTTTSIDTLEDFTAIVDKYATIQNYAGAGKYGGYDIHEIKNEIFYVVSKVPAFNQWFRMPNMREEEGYISIPYYESWAYYLEMDEETNTLSVTRVCWCTRSSYLDFDSNTVVEDHSNGTAFRQYEIMKTNYYFNEDGDEVVESYIYSVGVDNVKDGATCNKNTKDYYPFEYQYLKNVKDKLLIKYHITVAERYRDDEVAHLGFNDGGMDIRGLNPYGVRREFMIVNYDGYTNIDMTQIDQKFATLDNVLADGSVDFDINSNNIKLLVDNIGLSDEEYSSSTTAFELMEKIAKQIIDNFEIKNNWAKIYRESSKAYEIKKIQGPFKEEDIIISYLHLFVSSRNWDKRIIEFDASSDVYDMSKFDVNKEYSLSMALRNKETGKLYIVATDYNLLESVQYNGGTDYYYRLQQTSINLNSSNINIDENGEYDITCVLTVKENNEDVIIFDTLQVAYLKGYYGLEIPDSIDENGVTHNYAVKGIGGKLTITVSSEEI